jgi:exodeoxyribonuclease VII large subunit
MDDPSNHEIYTVSRLNEDVRVLLEQAFASVWVEGEISNLAQPRSGHVYFSLKDEQAQVRCALFRNRALRLRFQPENGAQVRIRARIGLYAPRGEYQLIAEHMEPAGDGALQRAFEALKAKLSAEGLFDSQRHQPLPSLPKRIGVITSPTGAAIRDFTSVLKRRFPALPVLIYPVAVQGSEAAGDIVDAINLAAQRAEVDVLVITRGGGSLEDLQAFNDERVARAIAACPLPTVSAVGHEVDISIADWVADQRAATPSAAAELLSPDPGRQLRDRAQRLDELEQRLIYAAQRRLAVQQQSLQGLSQRLFAANPQQAIQQWQIHCVTQAQRLRSAWDERLALSRARLQENARALEAISPLATLERGYAIVERIDSGDILRRADAAQPGEQLRTRLGHGELISRVESITPDRADQ